MDAYRRKAILICLARSGGDRPTSVGPDGVMGRVFSQFMCSSGVQFDPVFARVMLSLRPDWFRGRWRQLPVERKAALLGLARSGGKRPNYYPRDADAGRLGQALRNYAYEGSSSFDPVFKTELFDACPGWFYGWLREGCDG